MGYACLSPCYRGFPLWVVYQSCGHFAERDLTRWFMNRIKGFVDGSFEPVDLSIQTRWLYRVLTHHNYGWLWVMTGHPYSSGWTGSWTSSLSMSERPVLWLTSYNPSYQLRRPDTLSVRCNNNKTSEWAISCVHDRRWEQHTISMLIRQYSNPFLLVLDDWWWCSRYKVLMSDNPW